MASEMKSGYLLRYKRRIFGKDWREEFVVLYSDSTLVWYKEKGRTDPEGGIIIRRAPELMAYGLYTSRIPNRPELPNGYQIAQLMAFGTRGKETVHWFLCPNVEEVMDWMTAFSNTLPPPPQPPQQNVVTNMNAPVPPPPATAPPPNGYISAPGEPNKLLNGPVMDGPPPPYHLPGMPLQPAYGAYSQPSAVPVHYQQPHFQQPMGAPNSTNVTVVQGGGNNQPARNNFSGGDFALGFVVGGALTGWGSGWGWGSHGLHTISGGTAPHVDYHITDIHNHIDMNQTTTASHTSTSIMNNDTDIANSLDDAYGMQDDMMDAGGFGADFGDCGDFGGF